MLPTPQTHASAPRQAAPRTCAARDTPPADLPGSARRTSEPAVGGARRPLAARWLVSRDVRRQLASSQDPAGCGCWRARWAGLAGGGGSSLGPAGAGEKLRRGLVSEAAGMAGAPPPCLAELLTSSPPVGLGPGG